MRGRFGQRFRRWRLWRIDSFFFVFEREGEGREGKGRGGGRGDAIPTVEFELN